VAYRVLCVKPARLKPRSCGGAEERGVVGGGGGQLLGQTVHDVDVSGFIQGQREE